MRREPETIDEFEVELDRIVSDGMYEYGLNKEEMLSLLKSYCDEVRIEIREEG